MLFQSCTLENPRNLNDTLWKLKNDNPDSCDANLIIKKEEEETKIPVHSLVLASLSEYFKRQFETKKEIEIDGVDEAVLCSLIEYCYTGKIKTTTENAKEVMVVAKRFDMYSIAENIKKHYEVYYKFDECEYQWRTEPDGHTTLIKSSNHRCLQSCNTMLAIGEDCDHLASMELYDVNRGEWLEVDIDCKRTSFAVVSLNNGLLIIGGSKNDLAVKTVDFYDFKLGKTKVYPSLHVARCDISAVHHDNMIYVIGGYNRTHVLSCVERFNCITKTWEGIGTMKCARKSYGAAVLGREIFVVGGKGKDGLLNSTEALDVSTKCWRKRASMNENRVAPGVAVIGKYMYAVGGQQDGFTYSNTVEKYDSQINKWTMIQPLDIGTGFLGAVNLNDSLFIVGGRQSEESIFRKVTTVQVYNNKEKRWQTMAPLKNPCSKFSVVKILWDSAEHILSRTVTEENSTDPESNSSDESV